MLISLLTAQLLVSPVSAATPTVMLGAEVGVSNPIGDGPPSLTVGTRAGRYAVEDYGGFPVIASGGSMQLHYDVGDGSLRTGLSAQTWVYFVGAEAGLVAEFTDRAVHPGVQVSLQPTIFGLAFAALRVVHIPTSASPWTAEFALQAQWPRGFWKDRL